MKNNLVSKDIAYKMEVVGSNKVNVVQGKIYLLHLVDIHNNTRTIWGYGIYEIMQSGLPRFRNIEEIVSSYNSPGI